MRTTLVLGACLALAACGESRPAPDAKAEAAATNANAQAGGTAREIRGVDPQTAPGGGYATDATEPGRAASTTTPPNHPGGAKDVAADGSAR